jgi:mono/diheme cytochrome c family protein
MGSALVNGCYNRHVRGGSFFIGAMLVAAMAASGVVSSARQAPVASHAPAAGPPDATTPRAFVEQHCITCHNDRARAAGLSLTAAPADVTADAALWEKVLHKVRSGQMPPAGRPRPDAATARAVVRTIADTLDRHAALHPQPARVGAHRLNRTEYANAVRDVLGLDVDASALLLPDEADDGFDNIAASLALSPAHLERYLAAARQLSRLAVGDRTLADAPASALYKLPKLLEQDVRLGDDLPFGSRGGLAVRHFFPVAGDYTFKVRLRRQVYDYIIGMGHPQALDLRVDGVRVQRFTVGGAATGMPGPLTWNGEIVGETRYELYMHAADDGLEVRTRVAAGSHVVSASFVDTPWEVEGVQQPMPLDFARGADEMYEGLAAVDSLAVTGPFVTGSVTVTNNANTATPVTVTDPVTSGAGSDTSSRRAIFVCSPAATATPAVARDCASRILTRLATRAYRRPATPADVATLLTFYDTGRANGGFDAGIQQAVERMLVSFNFLFRIERAPTPAATTRAGTAPRGTSTGAYRVTDLDLASRLSFFLWNSVPDDTLRDLAVRGRLRQPAVLEQQVRRMLADPRARALTTSFAAQWLTLRKASAWLPDPNFFPEFDENLRRAFIEETTRFLDDQRLADRSVLDLIRADYSFVNARLAEHYGLPGITGDRFRKVTFTDGARGGVLGQGSVLMVTSYPDRTAPVVRGAWVLENLLGMPPPPPPPNVPQLQATDTAGKPRTMRAQMELHRQNPACATCHVRMDPLGFSLENFDAIGRWRTRDSGGPIDAASVFADGTPIDGVAGLRRFLLQHQDDYVETFVSKMLTYALGRHVDHRDMPAIRRIVREAAPGEFRWTAIILGIVKSTPFQMGTPAS